MRDVTINLNSELSLEEEEDKAGLKLAGLEEEMLGITQKAFREALRYIEHGGEVDSLTCKAVTVIAEFCEALREKGEEEKKCSPFNRRRL